uniref:KIB1-4 beta-propeller domain-containing protein n=2 Tax=Aegilops tauschii TaxID=37682 RepID=M8C065_AEGTA
MDCPIVNHGFGDARGPVVSKIVLSQPPTSDGCIMAAMTENHGIMLSRVGCPGEGWTIHDACHCFRFKDIAFCNSDLYGVVHCPSYLLKYKIGMNKGGAAVFIAHTWIDMRMLDNSTSASPYMENASYVVNLNGYPTVVVINRWWGYPNPFFRMFKLINTNTWSQVTMLGDHALFLGPTFSKAVNVPTGSHGNIERNHVYYSNGLSRSSEAHGDEVFLTISNNDVDLKYNINHRKIIASNYKIKSVGYFVKDDSHDSMWLLPPDI